MSAPIEADGREAASPVSCERCEACCCRLEVLLMGEDDVPVALSGLDQWGAPVMRRLEDGWCAALDRNTLRCTIYARRPALCREFEVGSYACLEERSRFLPAGTGGRPGPEE
jgi:Fe-S-cluster containining protein